MADTLLIRNAKVVSPRSVEDADVYVAHGRIQRVGGCGDVEAEEVIEARGLWLLPGVLDAHVHFRSPGMEWKEDFRSGSLAAVAGGVTSIIDMPNTDPPTVSAERLAGKRRIAAERSLANYGFYIGANGRNLEALNRATNVAGIKVYMGSSTGSLLVDQPDPLERIFANGTARIGVHAEDEEGVRRNRAAYDPAEGVHAHEKIRSPEVALAATKRAVSLASTHGRRLHILHVSTREEVAFLSGAKKRTPVAVEVCPQHFLLHSPDVYDRLGTFAQMNPPLRGRHHTDALWQGLKAGVIDYIASDHAPHTAEEKRQPYGKAPSGLPGVETILPLMLDRVAHGACTVQEVVRWMCERPAELFGVRGKGKILPGMDADLVLVDMKKKKRIENGSLHTRVNWSPFHGWETRGWPVITLVNGHAVYREGSFDTRTPGKELVFTRSG